MVIASLSVGLLGVLLLGFAVVRAPLAPLLVPVLLIALCVIAVRNDVLHVRRHGWSDGSGSDGSDGEGRRGGPDEPDPPIPSGDGDRFDWDAFELQFQEHVDREPVA